MNESRQAAVDLQRLLAAGRERAGSGPIDPPGGGGDDGGMNTAARVDALEKRTGKIEDKIDRVTVDVAEIKGRVSQMPTTWQIATWFIDVNIGLAALVFAVAPVMR